MSLWKIIMSFIMGREVCSYADETGHIYTTVRKTVKDGQDVGVVKCKKCGAYAWYNIASGQHIEQESAA